VRVLVRTEYLLEVPIQESTLHANEQETPAELLRRVEVDLLLYGEHSQFIPRIDQPATLQVMAG
jgi:hypothetical protein